MNRVLLDNDAGETARKFNAAPVYVGMNRDGIAEIRKLIVGATD
jgi:hypothetical protein